MFTEELNGHPSPGISTGDPRTSLVVARGLRGFIDGLGGVGQALMAAGLSVIGGPLAVLRLRLAHGASAARLGLERDRVLGEESGRRFT